VQSTEKVFAAQQETADVLIPLQDSAIQCPCRDLARNAVHPVGVLAVDEAVGVPPKPFLQVRVVTLEPAE